MATLNDNITRVNNTLKDIQNAINNSDIVSVDKPSDYANAINIINTYANDSIDMIVSDDTFISRITAEGCNVVNESQAKINYIGGNSEVSENLIVLEDKEATTINGITYSIKDGVGLFNGETNVNALNLDFDIKPIEFKTNDVYSMTPFTTGFRNIGIYFLTAQNGLLKWSDNTSGWQDRKIGVSPLENTTCSKIRVAFNSIGVSVNNLKLYFTLLKGSTAPTEFKQGFLGIRNATPNKLVSYGANLLNVNDVTKENEYWGISNQILSTDFNYVFSFDKPTSNMQWAFRYCDKDGNILYAEATETITQLQTLVKLEPKKDYKYFRLRYRLNVGSGNLMLNVGSNALPYTPYIEPTSIDIPLYSELLSAGNVRDKYYPNGNLVRNVGVRDYVVGDENNSNYLTDMTTTYYPLATPIVSQAQVWQDNIKVYKGGTETFEGTKIGINLNSTYAISKLEVVANVNEND